MRLRQRNREVSVEEFEARRAAMSRFGEVAAAADEEGGPRLSLVPAPDRATPYPTDLLPPADPDAADHDPTPTQSFDGVALPDSRRRMGWSAERQRIFLGHLAETGSVHLASAAAQLTARSAYQLRTRSPAFAAAWETAEQLAAGRLAAIAFDRAIEGRVEQLWQDGELVAEKRVPSDRLLMWLLARLDPRRFAPPAEQLSALNDPVARARTAFPEQLDTLSDLPAE